MSEYTVTIEASGMPDAEHAREAFIDAIDHTTFKTPAIGFDREAGTVSLIANLDTAAFPAAHALNQFKLAATRARIRLEVTKLLVELEPDQKTAAA